MSVQLFTSKKTEDVTKVLNRCISTYERPGKILADNVPQFRDTFDEWCTKSKRGIEVVHASPFYPQCKGKIERCIRILMRNTSALIQCLRIFLHSSVNIEIGITLSDTMLLCMISLKPIHVKVCYQCHL